MSSLAPASTLAVKYSSQKPWKAKMVIVPTAGVESGSMTLKNIVPWPPPSSITDSESESGSPRKKFRRKKVCPQTLVAVYTSMRPSRVPMSPFLSQGSSMPRRTRNCGMMFRKLGIISVKR